MRRITSSFLAIWCTGPIAIVYVSAMGMAYLVANVDQLQPIEMYPMSLIVVLVGLMTVAMGFYQGLRKYVKLPNQRIEPTKRSYALQRVAAIFGLAALCFLCVIIGLAFIRENRYTPGFLWIVLGAGFSTTMLIVTLRRFHAQERQTATHETDSIGKLLAFGTLVTLMSMCFIGGTIWLRSGWTLTTLLLFASGLALLLVLVTVPIREIRGREALLTPETRVFRTAMTIFGLSVLVVTTFFASIVMLVGLQLFLYGASTILVGGLFLWILLSECKKTALRLSAPKCPAD
jgi:hypothetical protein